MEDRDGTGDPQGGPGRVEGPFGRSRKGRGTLGEVRDGLGDPREGPGRAVEPSVRFGMGQGTLGDVQDGSGNLGKVRGG